MHGFVSKGGMGIGLYVAHELALLHHGSLFYDEQSLDGVRFCLTLPARPDSYSEDERASVSALKPETPTSETVERETLSKMLTPLNDRMVLIIEDDADMAEQLELEIGSYFRVETCSDGKMGFQHACELNPDVVVCDVMLPSMDGYEITQQLKAQEATSRLPIILLTAFTDDQHHVKGIEAGADAFLTKPCNARVLLSLIMKLMSQRKQDGQKRDVTMHGSPTIQETVEQLIENIKQEPGTFEVIITDMGDKKFRERLQDTVAHRLHDKNFNVDELMQTMNMGRTQFYKKCKEVMGMSPNEYIRNARMLKAVQLLQEGEMNVNQVSYAVGIDNPSYFIRCFKAKYGMKPSQYKKI
jgi:DNA-binding response OmpR family regulator